MTQDVLWVEDQPHDNQEFSDIITKHGDHIFYANNVAEAYRNLDERDFDLVILDLKIPLGLGKRVENLIDGDFNGQYVVEYFELLGKNDLPKIFCLTNFHQSARRIFENKPIRILKKTGFLREFKEAVYGGA